MRRLLFVLMLSVIALVPLHAQCTYSNVTTSTFAATFSAAPGGSTICLTAGSYGTFIGASKSSAVTIQADTANGGTQANVIFAGVSLVSASNITFKNMTIGGGSVGSGSTAATHIHFSNIVFSGALCINTPTNVNQDTLVDSSSFVNIGQSCTEGRLGITGNNVSHTVANGVVITNTLFSGSGPSDGIQINGGAYGTVIGPGNTFTGILESGCGAVHCDSIQFYGAINTTITGNFFINDSDAIMSPDCNGSPMTVTNNVFVQDPTSATNEIIESGGNGDVFDHNTFGNTHSNIRLGNPNGCGLNTNITLTNNVLMGGISLTDGQSASTFTQDYNLIPGGGTGSHTISGSPTFVGGGSPTTVAGFQLTSGSLGFGTGLTGTNIGVLAVTPLPQPVIAYGTAAFTSQDGITNNYPSIGASPTFQQAEPIIFSPANFGAVISSGATPFPNCVTIDGSTPTATTPGTCSNGTAFTYGGSNTLSITGSVTVKAMATGVGQTNSAVTTAVITVQPFFPAPGTYSYSPFLATLTGNMGSNLIYTTNGTTPTANGSCAATNGTAVANGTQITLASNATTTVKFIPCVGGTSGSVQTGVYTTQGATTWYVRPDGGTRFSANVTAGQCNGKFNASYASTGGTGTNQNCAYNDYRFLYDDDSGSVGLGAWVIAGGDTVIISGCTASANQANPANPTCRIGWDQGGGGGPTNLWCQFQGNDVCTNPVIPSGSVTQPTSFLGSNFGSCATGGNTNPRNYTSGRMAQLFGGFGLRWTIDLRDTQNVAFSCIEFTTHNGVCSSSGSPNYPRSCSSNSPVDDYAQNGFHTNRNTAGITLTDFYAHGFNASALFGPIGNGFVLTRVFDGFNGFSAWNMDDGNTTPNGVHSTLTQSFVTMIGNGCYEEYPVTHSYSAQACYDTNDGGFGDTWSGQDTQMDTFTCDHCDVEYNTKDGMIGPHPLLTTMTITNSTFIGNMGSPLKWISDINGHATLLNNLVIGNCARMSEALPGAAHTFDQGSGLGGAYLTNYCRGGGNAIASNMQAGAVWLSANNTFVNNWDDGYHMFIDCGIAYHHPSGTCATATNTHINETFLGYRMSGQLNGPALFSPAGDPTIAFTFSHSIDFGNKPGSGVSCGTTGNLCTSPVLVGQPAQTPPPTSQTFLDGFNFNITGTSPAISAGVTYTGILSTDNAGNTQTVPPVIGALIFASGTPTVATPTASPAAGTYSSTQTVTLSTTTGGATICYTIDGSTPTATTPGTCSHGTTYSGTITIATTTTIMALGTLSGDANSAVATFAYTITVPTVATPTASPVAGTYTSTQSVTLSDATSGAAICFTTDGSTPTALTAGTCSGGTTQTYSAAISVASTTTIKAIGSKAANTNSSVFSGLYTITLPVAPTVNFGTFSISGSVTIP